MMSDAQRRLLDLLAGWSAYADSCGEANSKKHPGVSQDDYRREAEAIADLYQEVGRHEPLTSDEVEAFLRERVLAILVDGPVRLTAENEPSPKGRKD